MYRRKTSRLADDSGIAMITVIGIIVVISALAVASYTLANQALLESKNVQSETQAYRAAASGLDRELATFQDTDKAQWATIYPKTGSTQDGTFTVSVETIDAGRYRLVSRGDAGGMVETVAQEFYFLNLWKMNFAGGSDDSLVTGAKLTGSSIIIGPFYSRGDLELEASMSVQEGPLFVYDGDINRTKGTPEVGRSGAPIDIFCRGDMLTLYEADGVTQANKVFINTVNPSVPKIETPRIEVADLKQYAAAAIAESTDNNMGPIAKGVQPNLERGALPIDPTDYTDAAFTTPYTRKRYVNTDTDASLNQNTNPNYKFIGDTSGSDGIGAEGAGAFPLVIDDSTPSFGWWGDTYEGTTTVDPYNGNPIGFTSIPSENPGVYDTNVHDDFAWDAANHRLYIEGTVFVDGDVILDVDDIRYIGNGTIVSNGDILVTGMLRAEGTVAQARTNKWALGLVTPTTITFTMSSGHGPTNGTAEEIRAMIPDAGGAFYAEDEVTIPDKMLMQGSIITGKINGPSQNMFLVTNPWLPEYLPDSLPGSLGGLLTPTRWMRY